MVKIVTLKSSLTAASVVAAILGAACVAQAQAVPHTPQIKYEPVAAHPPIPTGLNAACTKAPDDGYQASKTCPERRAAPPRFAPPSSIPCAASTVIGSTCSSPTRAPSPWIGGRIGVA